ncbi:Double-stranded RNA-binding protein Staufen 1 [Dermatophagoides pteronyssinus]|uniref:Double-stranded RNA-binding protein Staufen 1 n=1 Tax=Dermatophagoides pteronyssinus TaxID=6956 RepID=A0ABQ8IS11_DERPT|nr:Double-stranded RNA-binding protein Staufen 1 [Dermatophagoides pteronyssinus]
MAKKYSSFKIHQPAIIRPTTLAVKDAMSMINELCHLHKIKPEYELIDVQGPEHNKIFTVYVKLGVSEKHNGQGNSIRNAQQNAALNALGRTRLKFPNSGQKQHNRRKLPWNNQNHLTYPQKPKQKFESSDKSFIGNGIQPHNHVDGSFQSSVQAPSRITTKMNPSISYTKTLPYQNQFHHHVPLFQPSNIPVYQNIPTNITYFHPTYFCDPCTCKQYLVYELVNPGHIPVVAHPFVPNLQSTSSSKSKVKIESEIKERQLNIDVYEASVEFNGVKFCGQGKTRPEARQIATEKALKHIKSNLFAENSPENSTISSENPRSDINNSLTDPISTLNHLVSRNRYKINFIHVDSYGPAHIPVFVSKCQLFDAQNNEKLLIETEGRDHSKKLAKKQAAQNMLAKIDNDNIKNILYKGEKADANQQPSCSRSEEHPKSAAVLSRDLDFISNKSLTLLYDLARNMSLRSPAFNYFLLNSNDSIAKRFIQQIESKGQIHRVECTLFFEQNTTDKFIFCMKTVGFSLTQRMAKQIAAFICLLRLGLEPPRFDLTDELFVESLRFSLEATNVNIEFPNEENIRKFYDKRTTIDVFYRDEFIENFNENRNFEINKKFVLFVAKKFYYYSLKHSTTKSIDVISEKIPFLFVNFEKNYQSTKFQHFSVQSIQKLLSTLDMKKYWNHLQFIAKLTTLGITDTSKSAIEFKCHTCRIDDSHIIAFLSVRFDSLNFDLIHKHYITFGFGCDDDKAREAASLRALYKISINAYKKSMEVSNSNPISVDLPTTIDCIQENKEKLQPNQTNSKPSLNQMKSKSVISRMYQICRDLSIRKPEFITNNWNSDLLSTQCIIHFRQDSNKLAGKLTILAISNSKRSAQTIAAYMFLSIANVSKLSLSQLDAFSIPDFEKYLKFSLENVSNPEIISLVMTSKLQFTPIIYSDEQIEDINRNIEFIETLLKDVYSSYLKNQKRSDPSCLFQRVEDKLFEYHNHRKQMLDQSESFDRWSEHIRKWINENLTDKFNRQKYWDHLQSISLIASTLNSNLVTPIEPFIFEFKCRLLQIDIENDDHDPTNQKGTIAMITLHCSSKEFSDRFALLQKEFLSFAIDYDENEAREIASYKALRYLSINLWKSIC